MFASFNRQELHSDSKILAQANEPANSTNRLQVMKPSIHEHSQTVKLDKSLKADMVSEQRGNSTSSNVKNLPDL